MSKQTQSRKMRMYDIGKDSFGKPMLTKLDMRKPPNMKEVEIKCGILKFKIWVGEGQMINQKKMCARLKAKYYKDNNI